MRDELGWTCSTQGRDEKCKILLRKFKERVYFEAIGIDKCIILGCILKK
jgi:hypothetical protein